MSSSFEVVYCITLYIIRMKAELSKVRQTYSVKYQEFIHNIQAHAQEVNIVFFYL